MLVLVALTLGLSASCAGDAAASRTETLVITGSSTIAPLAVELGLRFESQNPGLRVDVQSGGSSRGISDVRSGHAQIGMASRALKPSESDLKATPVARDGIALVVHKDNLIDELSSDQVRGIFTGQISNWSAVGGKPGRITVVNKAEGRATLEVFLKHFDLAIQNIDADVIAGENEQAIKTIAGAKSAIGYVSIGTAKLDIQAGVPIKLLSLDSVPATEAFVADGSYTMVRPLNFVTKGQPRALAERFIDFARSAENTDLISREAFIPLVPQQ